MTNRFPTWCSECKARILAEQGTLLGKDEATGRWSVRCTACERAAVRLAEAPRRAAEAEKARAESAAFYESLRLGLRIHEIFATQTTYRPRCLAILGLEPPVDAAAVKRRFRQLALESHSDRGGDPTRFVEVRAAYDAALALVEATT